ncbi:MAG: hypothetical protein KF746_11350 [Chitinophagaceae bacterium]|nr:hypothetical protein [Chitinophagaceae bacterium]
MHEGYSNHTITAYRSAKNRVDPYIPYHFLHETEPGLQGGIETVNTVFLTGKECAFKCLMCDLWKNTLDEAIPGAILRQIDYALERLPPAENIKLYNNGNFFDTKAISPVEYPAIAERISGYKRVTVENHPKLVNQHCSTFNDLLAGKLEIAMGLETIHPAVLPALNKQITPEDFRSAARYLAQQQVDVRAFVLLNPPYITNPYENIEWTLRSVQFAFESGAKRCSVIPVRPGNGIMDVLLKEKDYVPPSLDMLEEVVDKALALKQGQVLADTWDIGFLSRCAICFDKRKERLAAMNLSQQTAPNIQCTCKKDHG